MTDQVSSADLLDVDTIDDIQVIEALEEKLRIRKGQLQENDEVALAQFIKEKAREKNVRVSSVVARLRKPRTKKALPEGLSITDEENENGQ